MTFLVRVALACSLLVAPLAAREADAGAPTDQLRSQVDRVLKLLEDPALQAPDKARERRAAVRKVADEIFDFGETARRALGRHWAARTPEERDEFVRLFGDLLERSYISKIELYGGEKIQYIGDRIDGETALVQSKLLTKNGSEVPIEYRMLKKAERWLV
jgi:phospholipid transport system substrate-binding protein